MHNAEIHLFICRLPNGTMITQYSVQTDSKQALCIFQIVISRYPCLLTALFGRNPSRGRSDREMGTELFDQG